MASGFTYLRHVEEVRGFLEKTHDWLRSSSQSHTRHGYSLEAFPGSRTAKKKRKKKERKRRRKKVEAACYCGGVVASWRKPTPWQNGLRTERGRGLERGRVWPSQQPRTPHGECCCSAGAGLENRARSRCECHATVVHGFPHAEHGRGRSTEM